MTTSTTGGFASSDSVGQQLTRMTLPLIWGILATMSSQVAITWCVGRLGVNELAAVGFAFPVVMTIVSFGIGLGAGTSSAVAQDVGRGDRGGVARLSTVALWLAGLGTAALSLLGLATISVLFRSIGASEAALPLIVDYMRIWFLFAPFYIASMVGLSALRATGDMRFQGIAMVAAALLSTLLAPALIFGVPGIRAQGLAGAAIASGVPWVLLFIVTLRRMKRLGMLTEESPPRDLLARSLRRLFTVAVPAAATNIIIPVAATVVTAMIAPFGAEAVAGFGIASRVEGMVMFLFLALSAIMNPFAGHNLGCGRLERVHVAVRLVTVFCLGWGASLALALGVSAHWLASQFTDSAAVAQIAASYWHIVPISYGASGIIMCANASFNGLGRPLAAVTLSTSRVIFLNLPIAWLGARLFGATGVFFGICAANLLVGSWALVWLWRTIEKRRLESDGTRGFRVA